MRQRMVSRLRWLPRRLSSRYARQVNVECGAGARAAFHADVPAALLYDPVNHRQAQPRSLAHFLGSKEGLEYPRLGFRVHPLARIGYTDPHIFAGRYAIPALAMDLDIRRGDGNAPAPRHGVLRVDRQVHQHLFDLVRIRLYISQVEPRREGQRHGFLEEPAQHACLLPD